MNDYSPIVKLMADLLARVNAGTLTVAAAAQQMPDGLGVALNNNGRAVIVTVPKEGQV